MNRFIVILSCLLVVLLSIGCTKNTANRTAASSEREKEKGLDLQDPWTSDLYIRMREKGPEDTETFLKLSKSANLTERRVGVRLLGEIGDVDYPGVKDALGSALNDSDRIVRWAAIGGIGVQGLSEFLPRIRQTALDPEDESERALICLAMMPSEDSISVVRELLKRKEEAVKWREKHKEITRDIYWYAAHNELTLLWILEGIRDNGEETFLKENAERRDATERQFIFFAMAWTRKRDYLNYVWPVLNRAQNKDSKMDSGAYAAIHAVRVLATYEEALPVLQPLIDMRRAYIDCVFTLRYLKWKEQKQKKEKMPAKLLQKTSSYCF